MSIAHHAARIETRISVEFDAPCPHGAIAHWQAVRRQDRSGTVYDTADYRLWCPQTCPLGAPHPTAAAAVPTSTPDRPGTCRTPPS